MEYDVKDLNLAKEGKKKIDWAERNMPVLRTIKERFLKDKPLEGVRIGACLHVTTETANLMITLKAGGADVRLAASNPLSTQDETAASLVKDFGIPVFAITGENNDVYYKHLQAVLDLKPQITMDDGADLLATYHKGNYDFKVLGGTEETTTGVIRLKAMAKDNALKYPIIAVNDAMTKHLFDNRYGTGQSTLDGVIRATNILLAGSTVVVGGYGWCSKGIAAKAKGMGSNVIVTEVEPVKALEAVMDGFRVMKMIDAAPLGDLFITSTGDINVIDKHHFENMKDNAIICNSGHFDVEINKKILKEISKSVAETRPLVNTYILNDGRRINLLAEGRLINLSAAEGHPSMVMDMSFANQSLSAEYIWNNYKNMKNDVSIIPEEIDTNIAKLKLQTMGIGIDKLTKEQEKYLSSWEIGT
ncbi:adenosylhomocysteinase [bacterium]|nr:adenosylhomocysteinase [bacterium]